MISEFYGFLFKITSCLEIPNVHRQNQQYKQFEKTKIKVFEYL